MSMKVIDSLTPEQNTAVLAVIDAAIDRALERAGRVPLKERLLRKHEVMERTGLAKSTLYLKIRQGLFAPPQKLNGERISVWPESYVDSWIAEQLEGKS